MKKLSLLIPVVAVFAISLSIIFTMPSCKKSTPAATPTLYDSLGGTALVADPSNSGATIESGRLAIRSVIDSTIFVIAADTAINGYFMVLLAEVKANNLSGFSALSKNLTDFVATAAGAKDYTYSGLSMANAHNPATNSRISMKVDAADFNQFINDVVVGAKKNGVSTQLIGQMGALLGTVQSQVDQR